MSTEFVDDKELEAIKQRAAKATPGAWSVGREWPRLAMMSAVRVEAGGTQPGGVRPVALMYLQGSESDSNAEFIAHARTDVPALCASLEEARRQNAKWQQLDMCSVCGGQPLASGRECVCGGRGTADAERAGLRVCAFDLEKKLDEFRDALMWACAESKGADSITGLHVCDDYLDWERAMLARAGQAAGEGVARDAREVVGYLTPTTCVECGKSGEMRVENPAIIHKTVLCPECKAAEEREPSTPLN